MREPTVSEIADEVGISEKDVINTMNISYNVVSLDGEYTEDNGNLKDIFEDYSYLPDKELLRKSLKEDTLKYLEEYLQRKEMEIILYRFSFYGGKKYTLKTIGDKMGISPETVRQIEMRALKKLSQAAETLKDYVYN
jgi:RNA polymerase primary sigma factor